MAWIASCLLGLFVVGAEMPMAKGLYPLQTDIPGVGQVLYAVSVPDGYRPSTPAPLVLVLHPGGERPRHYGAQFTRRLVEPGLRQLKPIMIAPDCPARDWSDAGCEKSAMTLVDEAMRAYNIDRKRVLVVGYSMGGRGTWYMAAKHPDLFTAAIPMAASTRELTVDQLGRQPTYVIHSRADEVVPFDPAEKNARDLKKLKREVEFEALDDFTHFDMAATSTRCSAPDAGSLADGRTELSGTVDPCDYLSEWVTRDSPGRLWQQQAHAEPSNWIPGLGAGES